MRVITGQFKGRRLKTIPDRSIRPATDRVKQAVFDALSTRLEIDGGSVLDLFAGTGSLGIEALSRGATRCTFVESGRGAVACIEQNLAALGCSHMAHVVRSDAMLFAGMCRDRFRLIFADPPYTFPDTNKIPAMLFASNLIEPGGYLLIEHVKNMIFEEHSSFARESVRKFGTTCVSFFIHHEP